MSYVMFGVDQCQRQTRNIHLPTCSFCARLDRLVAVGGVVSTICPVDGSISKLKHKPLVQTDSSLDSERTRSFLSVVACGFSKS